MLSIAKHGSVPGFLGQKSGISSGSLGKNSHGFGDPRASTDSNRMPSGNPAPIGTGGVPPIR
jgi:hypothetical protein